MKVIIFYQYSAYAQHIDELCKLLNYNGIEADSLNITNWRFRTNKNKNRTFLSRLLGVIGKIPRVNGLTIILFRDFLLHHFAHKYDIVDIHFFSRFYDKLIHKFKIDGKKIKITIWGSDFYRADKYRREQQRAKYKLVDIIQIETAQIADDFVKVYPECAEKVSLAHFGIIQFDIIDELLKTGNAEKYKEELKIPKDKFILTCGTNRSRGHQHLLIMDEIGNLPAEIKTKLFMVFPMTYGGDTAYIQIVKKKADSLGIPYLLFPSFLSKNDIGKLRICSDILITIQITDALASAIQEYMYSGNIMIAGDWLPYDTLKENGIFYLRTSKEKLASTITESIENYATCSNMCIGNKDKLTLFSSWNEAIKAWVAVYNEM